MEESVWRKVTKRYFSFNNSLATKTTQILYYCNSRYMNRLIMQFNRESPCYGYLSSILLYRYIHLCLWHGVLCITQYGQKASASFMYPVRNIHKINDAEFWMAEMFTMLKTACGVQSNLRPSKIRGH